MRFSERFKHLNYGFSFYIYCGRVLMFVNISAFSHGMVKMFPLPNIMKLLIGKYMCTSAYDVIGGPFNNCGDIELLKKKFL